MLRRCRRLTQAELETLLAGYRAGTSVEALAERFSIHRATVHEHVSRAGLTGRRGVPKLAQAELSVAAQRYRDGWTLRHLAEHYRLDATTVRNLLRDSGITIRPPGRVRAQR